MQKQRISKTCLTEIYQIFYGCILLFPCLIALKPHELLLSNTVLFYLNCCSVTNDGIHIYSPESSSFQFNIRQIDGGTYRKQVISLMIIHNSPNIKRVFCLLSLFSNYMESKVVLLTLPHICQKIVGCQAFCVRLCLHYLIQFSQLLEVYFISIPTLQTIKLSEDQQRLSVTQVIRNIAVIQPWVSWLLATNLHFS